MARSKEMIVDEQIKKWNSQKIQKSVKPSLKTVVTISREPGSGGKIVAGRLAENLMYDLFDQDLVKIMAENSNKNQSILKTIDEKGLNLLDEWVTAVVEKNHLWPYEYMKVYLQVIGVIANHGESVIVGRGANFAVNPDIGLRVRIIAPLEVRVSNVVKEYSVPKEEALKRIKKTEAERSAFIRKYFYRDIDDNNNYDLIINMHNLSVNEVVRTIECALGL